ncbi:MAG TPA: S-methyl-5-thioribose-1-phosphate isomerase [Solirubrobacteraceae bacterium]|jgi:S-methyl-5-thioribose-1-phosphate isomerase|nr:S-methyl-5-thioribose-1-phosphate isomerase [Solirubrobacteraceae bacterium]
MAATESRRAGAVVALRYERGALLALDQTVLPWTERTLQLRSAEDVAAAIKRLSIRGAPLIGVAAGYGVALSLAAEPGIDALSRACATLLASRPTAVNLAWAVERVRGAALAADEGRIAAAALAEAEAIHADEIAASEASAIHGADLLPDVRRVLTHCNTGALAAPGRGTALSVIAELAARGRLEGVIATETRPLLQGARLTVYELGKLGIDHELVVDGAAAGLIARGIVDAVLVGCDRVAANGDVANKVGTYPLALAAHAAAIPFVVVGPISTIDTGCPSGAAIEIEERDADEVRFARGAPLTVQGTRCRNPAFDVTPAALVAALVTERGVAQPVDTASIAALLER